MDNITAINMLKMRNMGVNLPDEVYETAVIGLEELEQYRSIGTVSECREAVEKQRAKKPINGKIRKVLGYYQCLICGGLLLKNKKYCEDCGQAIDWSDTI